MEKSEERRQKARKKKRRARKRRRAGERGEVWEEESKYKNPYNRKGRKKKTKEIRNGK